MKHHERIHVEVDLNTTDRFKDFKPYVLRSSETQEPILYIFGGCAAMATEILCQAFETLDKYPSSLDVIERQDKQKGITRVWDRDCQEFQTYIHGIRVKHEKQIYLLYYKEQEKFISIDDDSNLYLSDTRRKAIKIRNIEHSLFYTENSVRRFIDTLDLKNLYLLPSGEDFSKKKHAMFCLKRILSGYMDPVIHYSVFNHTMKSSSSDQLDYVIFNAGILKYSLGDKERAVFLGNKDRAVFFEEKEIISLEFLKDISEQQDTDISHFSVMVMGDQSEELGSIRLTDFCSLYSYINKTST